MANLLETYKNRLAVADKVYSGTHGGKRLPESKKIATAKLLENVNRFLNEAFDNSVGTQRSDLGLWKKFCLNLTNVVNPNLIADELVLTQPLSSMSGYVTYVKYSYGSNKGTTTQGTTINDPFRLGAVDKNYSSAIVAGETKVAGTASTAYSAKLNWSPVIANTVDVVVGSAEYKDKGDGKLYLVTAGEITSTEVGTINYKTGDIALTATYAPTVNPVVNYSYDNVVIPQNDIPIINASVESIPLVAKARRVAIFYSQMAEFQAKQDYGFSLGDRLAEKGAAQLAYEIDTEVTDLLDKTAGVANAELKWTKKLPIGVSMRDHYASFAEKIEKGKQIIYDRTRRFAPTYMLIASDVLPVLAFVDGYKSDNATTVNGPYKAGTFNGLGVYVTPNIASGRYLLGVNGNDMMTSVAVYAPYMSIVPTQLLQYADGGTNQGFSTLYALEVLNADLIVAGEVTNDANTTVFNTEESPVFTKEVQ